jgi:hypothetical protein
MAFPFYKSIDNYIVKELRSRNANNNVALSKLVPWIKATSNLGGQYSLGTETYSTLFDGSSSDAYRNAGGSQWKYRPNPIITDFSVDFAARGTLRRCTLKIKCFSPDQLKIIQQYFLEPGISCFIQWGWNHSVSSGKVIGPLAPNAGNVNLYNRNAESLNNIRSANAGCYDNFVGIITGGSSNIAGEEFDVQVKMASMGEILMGKSSEGVTKDGEKVEPKNYPSYLYDQYAQNKDTRLNFAYFYDQLPDEYRTDAILNLESKFKHDSDFINYNESLIDEAKYETSEGTFFSGDLTFKGKSFKAQDSETPINGNKFISFEAFITLLNEARVKFAKSGPVDFKIDISKTYIGAFSGIFSTDERVFIPNKASYNFLNDIPLLGGGMDATIDTSINGRSFPITSATSVPQVEGGSVSLSPNIHGWIGDIYIENQMAMEALRNQTTPVKEILDGVLSKIEESVEGLWSFQITTENNSLKITDANLRNIRSGGQGDSIETFDMYGTNSFFLDASFDLDIPSAMASKVFMEKSTSTSGLTSPDELTTGLFSNQKDNILIRMSKEEMEKAKAAASDAAADEKRKWIEFRRNVKLLINPKIIEVSEIGDGNMDEWAICGQYLNKRKFNDIRKPQTGHVSGGGEVYNGRPLPVSFTFTVLGMSGFQVGHLYRINGLPDQYSNGRGAFQVEEITHKVDSKLWTTEVTGKFRPFYK